MLLLQCKGFSVLKYYNLPQKSGGAAAAETQHQVFLNNEIKKTKDFSLAPFVQQLNCSD